MTPARAKLEKLDSRISALRALRDIALVELSKEEGFAPCLDCMDGFCTMNCSNAPGYMKVFFP